MCNSTENKSVAAPVTAKVETTYRKQANRLIAFIEKKAKETGKEKDTFINSAINTLKSTTGDSLYYLRGWEGTIGRVAGIFGMTLETLYRIGEGAVSGDDYLEKLIGVGPLNYKRDITRLLKFINEKAKLIGVSDNLAILDANQHFTKEPAVSVRNWHITLPSVAKVLKMDAETLYLIGEGKEDGAKYLKPVVVKENHGHRLARYIRQVVEERGLKATDFEYGYNGWESLKGGLENLDNHHEKEPIEYRNITVPAFAKVLGVTPEYLYGIAKGKIPFPAPVIKPVIKVEPVKVEEVKMGAKEKAKVKKAAKATTRILPGGVKRIIHVFAPALKERFEGNKDNKLCCVRNANNLTRRYMYKKVECLGPSQLVELDEPLPGTNGRGICVMVTTEAIRVHY